MAVSLQGSIYVYDEIEDKIIYHMTSKNPEMVIAQEDR